MWYTSDGHISSSLIGSVLYDSDDMLWVATEDGLNRFDGSKFSIYRNDPNNPLSIANNKVNSLFEDRDGRLYVCTHAGVQIYDRASDSFSPTLNLSGRQGDSSPLQCVVQLPDGELWAVGNEVYRILGLDKQPVLEHLDLPDDVRFIAGATVDADGNVWLTKHPNVLFRITPDHQVKRYFGQLDDPMFMTMVTDSHGTLFAGSAKRGMYRYDKAADEFVHLDLGERLQKYIILNIYPDEFGYLLIGTDGGGLFVYNPDKDEIVQFPFSNPDYRKLKIHGLDKDPSGNLWVGVYQKGLLRHVPLSPFFKSVDQRLSNLLGSCCISAICRDSEGTLWVGTDNDDIFAVDLESNTNRHYVEKVPASIMSIFEDSKGRLWIGSYNRGFGTIDKHTGQYTPVPLRRRDVDVSHIYDFAQLADGTMLIASMGSGLFKFDPDTRLATPLYFNEMCDWITSLNIDDTTGDIYVATYDGLFVVSPNLKDYKKVLSQSIVYTVHLEPKHNDIWLGTAKGLVRLDRDLNLKNTYTEADGLPSRSVLAIEHADDALWLGTPQGLSKFNVYDGVFTNYTVSNGLPNNEFSLNASFKDNDGNIYFGGINGLTIFKASDIMPQGRKLSLRITDFLVGDRQVNASTVIGGRRVIDKPLSQAQVFRLAHDYNSFTVRINSREMLNSEHIDFFYKFDDDDWTRILPSSGLLGGVALTFSNVATGLHDLQVKAVNGGVESDILNVKIDVAPVWWASWWARLLYIVLAVALCYWVVRQIKARQQRNRQLLAQRHEQEILESKLQFFTNISHEIRTPLSLVIGPLQKLQAIDTDPKRQNSYHMILRNANRILRLVNELMDLRKIDNKQMRLRFSYTNLTLLVLDLYETFQQAASAKNITFVYNHQGCDNLMVWVDVSNFDKVIMNLLSNAMKFTPENGSILINLSDGFDPSVNGPLSEYAEISVTDTGIGISAEDRKNVFNRFFQGANNKAGGTGIGLHLTSQLVELHHGTISISDNPDGPGTRFTVRIPLGNDHLTDAELLPVEKHQEPVVAEASTPVESAPMQVVARDSYPQPKSPAPRSSDVVYVVEDDEEIRKYLVESLNRYFHTYGYSNGKLALEAIHERCPALVITDVMMPEMDGYTLTKKIKQNINLNRTPVIVLTAKTREEDNLEAIESGATVYISKPFNIDVVVRTAQNLIEEVARLRNAFSGNQSQEDKLEDIDVPSNNDKLMERVMKVINKNLSNSDITVEMIAREIGISRVHLHRKLKEITNQATRDFIRNIRLQAAAKLLREKKLSVAEVSDLVGFKHPNNFSTLFKEMFGMSPTAYNSKYLEKSKE